MSEMLTGDYLGMPLAVDAGDHANQAFFRACAAGVFKVQKCGACALLWYPPSTGCPHCGSAETELVSAFGATACKAMHRCLSCAEPFEAFKCL